VNRSIIFSSKYRSLRSAEGKGNRLYSSKNFSKNAPLLGIRVIFPYSCPNVSLNHKQKLWFPLNNNPTTSVGVLEDKSSSSRTILKSLVLALRLVSLTPSLPTTIYKAPYTARREAHLKLSPHRNETWKQFQNSSASVLFRFADSFTLDGFIVEGDTCSGPCRHLACMYYYSPLLLSWNWNIHQNVRKSHLREGVADARCMDPQEFTLMTLYLLPTILTTYRSADLSALVMWDLYSSRKVHRHICRA